MNLYQHYIEFDRAHLIGFKVWEFKDIIEKEKSFYGTFIRSWNGEVCPPCKIINKSEYKTILVENKACARIRIAFTYWSDVQLSEEEYSKIVKEYLLKQIESLN